MFRYETLDVSLQTDNRNTSRVAETLDYERQSEEDGDQQYRVKRFRQLYYKNQRLRRQLKTLNGKLNEKMEKLKLPNVKKKAMSVDLNHQPPSNKAQQRELDNAYKQVQMYKKRVQTLKIKQQTPQNYAKIKGMENAVAYKDMEIDETLSQLKSIKSIKKMQEKKITAELQNQQVKERIQQYQKQHKALHQKLKEIAKKSRKRQVQQKKRQAYLVSLQQFNRKMIAQEQKPQQPLIKVEKQITSAQWQQIKQQVKQARKDNDTIITKIQSMKKNIKNMKKNHEEINNKLLAKQALVRNLQIKIDGLKKLTRDPPKKKDNNSGIKLESLDEQNSDDSGQYADNYKVQESAFQRQWKQSNRKVQHGYMAPTDEKFQNMGQLKGLKVCLDQNQSISGLIAIYLDSYNQRCEGQLHGSRSNVELKWQASENDKISRITVSFNKQGYLTMIDITSKNGMNAKFGSSSEDQKGFDFKGIYGAIRSMGKDTRITQIGFWISSIKTSVMNNHSNPQVTKQKSKKQPSFQSPSNISYPARNRTISELTPIEFND